jgi:hypothetical protein
VGARTLKPLERQLWRLRRFAQSRRMIDSILDKVKLLGRLRFSKALAF